MKGRLVAMILPASVAGMAIGATAAAHRGGMISDGVFYWLWPSLVVLLWLALGIGALAMRWLKWSIPCFAACLVQLIGLLLLVARSIRSPLEILWYSLGTFVVVLSVILILWLVATIRTRALERKLVEGGGEGVDAQALARIRKDMGDALAMLRRAGRGRNAIYELPWLLVMGRPQGGKTFAIKNSGLNLPVKKDWVKGAGGTFTADWFFTNEMIFLDTPGKWVQEGVSEEGSKNWIELLRLLRRHRGRRPLDGLVVVVPADDLLSKSRDELVEQAAHVREVIDLIHEELKFRYPVYLLVSKTDLVEGFVDFFKGLPANRKHQIFGWSHPDPNDREAVGSIRGGFARVLRRMQAIRLEILARTASATGVRRLFFFTEEFQRLEDPLVEFAEALFQSDPYHETPVFRGFYFTSATQGDGTPLGQAMAQLARNLGVRTTPPAPGETEAKRSYFLLDMFRTLIVADDGLVSRTAAHWLRRRRDTVLAAFLPATIAAAIVFLALVSYVWNRSIYSDAAEEIPKLVSDLAGKNDISIDALDALRDIDKIREYHAKMTGFTLFRGLGMRQPGALATETFRIFRDELESRVLRPTFARATEIATNDSVDFATRADAFYSVVWLRQGNVVEYGDDLKGFEGIWNNLDPAQAKEARELLVTQFEHLLRDGPSDKDLLQGFDLAGVAASLKAATADVGSSSAIKRYAVFQDACGSPSSPNAIRSCNKQLRAILSYDQNDFRRLSKNLQLLKNDLGNIRAEESGASDALESLKDIHIPPPATERCFQTFEKDILPRLKEYYVDQVDDLVKQCRNVVDQKGRGAVYPTLDAQDTDLNKQQAPITTAVDEFNSSCSASLSHTGPVDVTAVFKLSRSFRRVECAREANYTSTQAKAAPRPPSPPPRMPGPSVAPKPPESSSGGALELFARTGVPSGYNQAAIDRKRTELSGDIDYAKGMPAGEKATKDAEIHQVVILFAGNYADAWQRYLRSIRLKGDPPPDVGSWLTKLSQTSEWRTVLTPAAEALGVTGDAAEPYFGQIYQKLAGLSNLSGFLNGSGLGAYTANLKAVATDVARCQGNPSAASDFRSKLEANDPANSLVKAQAWVDVNGGESLAQGALRDLLQRPLVVARESLGASADPNKRWTELVKSSQVLSHRFPFSGSDTDDLASADEIKAVFGGLSGIVTKLSAEKDKLQLGAESTAWLDKAKDISAIFFDPGSDAPKSYNLKVTLHENDVKIEPEKAAQALEWRLQRFDFETTDTFSWTADKDLPTTRTIKLELFGDSASGTSKLKLLVGHKDHQGLMRKVVWEDAAPPTVIASEDGAWPAFRALAKVKPPSATGDRFTLPLEAPFPYKKKTPPDGKLTVGLEVQGRQLATLLDLIKNGFGAAPATP